MSEESRRVTIEIPLEPPREVSSNYRGHWRAMHAARKLVRDTARLATYGLDGADREWLFFRYGTPVVVDAIIEWGKGRKRCDPTNLPHLLKSYLDGVSDVVWSGEDAHVHLGWITQHRGVGRVRLTFRAKEGA